MLVIGAQSIDARTAAWYVGWTGSRDPMDRLSPVQTNADNHGVNRSRGLSKLGHHNVIRRDSVTPDVTPLGYPRMEDQKKNYFAVGCVALLAVALLAAITFLGFVGYGLSTGNLAATAALPQNKIPQNQLRKIAQIVNLRPDEKVLYFYSTTMTVSGDGNLFTNERVISYTNDSETLRVFDATYSEIEDITLASSTSWLADSTITITLEDGTMFDLWVSTESGRDKVFHARLIQEWRRTRDADRGVTKP